MQKCKPKLSTNLGAHHFECIECKSSDTASLTENQKVGFPEIEETGAIIVGKGKPEVEGGTVIPPTEVKVVRPPIPVKPVDTKAPVSRKK